MILENILSVNRITSRKLAKYLPQAKQSPLKDYENIVKENLVKIPNPILIDIGGGTGCIFSKDKPVGGKIISLDISSEQLEKNMDADEKLLADASKEIPLPDESVDMIVSHMVIEHLEFPEKFLINAYRVLKPGGVMIHIFPCKFAPFAIINSMISPNRSQKILYALRPESQNIGGFPAFYRKCYYSGMKKLFLKTGFEIKKIRHYHYQSDYFAFFLPMYVISAIYELLTLNIANLASYILIVAIKSDNLKAFIKTKHI